MAARIFRLTRVTGIFEKSVFTETTPGARAACRPGFRCATAPAAACGVFFAKKQENTGENAADESPAHLEPPRPWQNNRW
jgi:hypothetical protein